MKVDDFVTPSIRLVRMLGQGGMGSVWVATHERLRTEVVVKFIVGEYATDPDALARFEREATLAAQAKSPHVVQVFDHGMSQEGLPYIAMELLEGEDLAERIQREKSIDAEVFVDWFRQAASGLSRAHKKGIVHRDIKPENIFLCNEDDEVLVKVLDFGIAKSDAASTSFSGTRTGAMLGTAYYMSPEQTMGAKDLDHRADLWAMGVVAYYALTGVRPFDGEAIGQLVFAITQSTIPPPSTYNSSLPAAVDVWMKKALARDPEARFSSAKEMATALSQAVLGRIPTPRPSFGFVDARDSDASSQDAPRATTLSQAASSIHRHDSSPSVVPLTNNSRSMMKVAGGIGVLVAAAFAWWIARDSAEPEELPPVAAVAEQREAPTELEADLAPPTETEKEPGEPSTDHPDSPRAPPTTMRKPGPVATTSQPVKASSPTRPVVVPQPSPAVTPPPAAAAAPAPAPAPAFRVTTPAPKPQPTPKPPPPSRPSTPLHMAIE